MSEVDFVEGVGRFPIGHWHPNPDAPRFSWEDVRIGTPLGPLDWRFEAFEGPILCFLCEIREPRYLATGVNADPIALPIVAMWTSFSLLMHRFAFGPIVDVEHDFRWRRPLSLGEPTELSGEITDKFERRGRCYVSWDTRCRSSDGEPIFEFGHTIIDLRMDP